MIEIISIVGAYVITYAFGITIIAMLAFVMLTIWELLIKVNK